MLTFNADTTRQMELAYSGSDVTRRRRASFDAVNPEPGETIIDIGCGPGLLTLELARTLGSEGRVVAVDPSQDMRLAAAERCSAFPSVSVVAGTAASLPVGDCGANKAVSVQVFEYLDDIPAAVREAHRVLKPGGRLVVSDFHFGTWVWFSDNPERMNRMIAAWDHHFTERGVPALLPPILKEAGFRLERITPITVFDHVLRPDGLAQMLLTMMESFVVKKGLVDDDVAKAWSQEQKALAQSGRFFFSLTHFIVEARKMG
ncbi:MAG: methyltransferase domain-containing protein [Pseudomonadota bacterium]